MKLIDKNGRVFEPADAHSDSLVTMDTIHHRIHEGRAYFISGVAADIESDASYTVGLLTGTDELHLQRVSVAITGANKSEARVELLEGATVTDGTAGTVYNHNRRSTNTAEGTYKYGLTVSDAGTVLDIGDFGGASGSDGERTECIPLKDETQYALRITNKSTGTADVSWYALFYHEAL